jgi:hypothetical protein
MEQLMEWELEPKYSEKPWPSDVLSTTNSTWPDLESNMGYSGDFEVLAYISANVKCFEHFFCWVLYI